MFLSVELSYLLFSFLVEAELSTCINCNPVSRRTNNHPHETLWRSGLTSADSGLSRIWGIALNGCDKAGGIDLRDAGASDAACVRPNPSSLFAAADSRVRPTNSPLGNIQLTVGSKLQAAGIVQAGGKDRDVRGKLSKRWHERKRG